MKLVLALIIACCAIGVLTSTPDFNMFDGTYVSFECEPVPGAYVKRFIRLTDNQWFLQLHWYNGSSGGCSDESMFYVTEETGFYHFSTTPSMSVENAYPAEFFFQTRTVTPVSQAGLDWMNSLGCGVFTLYGVRDMMNVNCPVIGFHGAAACPQEFELMKKEIGAYTTTLTMGLHSNDMCSAANRPTVLGPYPLTKVVSSLIAGTWISGCVELDTNYAIFEWISTEMLYTESVMVFSDSACSLPLYTTYTTGNYIVWDPSSTILGAFNSQFTKTQRAIVPTSTAGVTYLNSQCDAAVWQPLVFADVSMASCPSIYVNPLTTCPTEYSVVKRQETIVYFGHQGTQRACSPALRPTTLSPMRYYRQSLGMEMLSNGAVAAIATLAGILIGCVVMAIVCGCFCQKRSTDIDDRSALRDTETGYTSHMNSL